MNTQKHWPTPSLENIPRDVLTQIIIHTVSLSSSTPTPRELTTVYSLLLTCRNVEQQLSLRNNPHLYADIFRLMFDVEAVGRRMGPSAITASALASELRPRIEALRRLKAVLDAEGTGSEVMSRDLTRIFLMITEDDGKNRHQLFYFVDLSRISDLLIAHSSRIRSSSGDFRHSTCVTLLVAIMWISSRTNLANGTDALTEEDPGRRLANLDCLEPFVFKTNSSFHFSPIAFFGTPSDRGSIKDPKYFTIPCWFRLPSASFARMSAASRYMVNSSGGQYLPEASTRFDDDWSRYLMIDQTILPGGGSHVPGYSAGTAEGLWEGVWCIPCKIKEIRTYIRAMKFDIREYVSFSSQDYVSFVSGGWARAWFPEGVKFDETKSSLRIYDPIKDRWLCYKPQSDFVELLGDCQRQGVFDTILVGSTEASHGAMHGDYVFHGRVRRGDGHIALVRKPATSISNGFGIWVFHGQIFGKQDFVGDWRTTSSAVNGPSERGWFHVSKIEAQPIFE